MTPPPKPPGNRPHELQTLRMKALGKASQILPSYLRIVCRSRLDCTPLEVLDQARMIGRMDLATAHNRLPDYEFIVKHDAIMHQYTTEQILDLIEEEIERQTPKSPYSTPPCRLTERGAGGKKACWICPVITATLQRLKPAFLPDTHPPRNPHKPYVGLWKHTSTAKNPPKNTKNRTNKNLADDLKTANFPDSSPE